MRKRRLLESGWSCRENETQLQPPVSRVLIHSFAAGWDHIPKAQNKIVRFRGRLLALLLEAMLQPATHRTSVHLQLPYDPYLEQSSSLPMGPWLQMIFNLQTRATLKSRLRGMSGPESKKKKEKIQAREE